MSIRVTQNSFSRGVLSPSLYGRVDLEQYSLGLKKLNNGIVLQEGCVQNRPGLEFLTKTKYQDKKCRLIPFVFDLTQNYIIEAGDKYFRFLKDGGYILDDYNNVYEIQSPYDENEVFELDYVQQADTITIVHQNHKPAELIRIKHNEWQYKTVDFCAKISPPENIKISYTGSSAANTTEYEYVVCSVDKNTKEESERSEVVKVTGHLEAYWTTAEYITLSWDSVENAQEYNIYRSLNGIFAYVGTSKTTTFKDNNIEPDLSSCACEYNNPFENENPTCVCYYQQRKIYAGSNLTPSGLWASMSGTNDNFNLSRPLNANDSISMKFYDNVANKIQHLIPFEDLIVLTTNGEWSVNGSDGIFSANPAPIAKIQSYYGASKVKPVISGSMVLFMQSGGTILRDLSYDFMSNSYDGQELTLFANHLFEGKQVIDMAYAKEPYRIVYLLMDDGTINALTYNPKQKISAWHTHTTKGKFESIASVREGKEDVVYFVVQREINSKVQRYIERFKTRTIKSLENAFFLDCALAKTFDEKVEKITGLEHLKNEKVNALLDYGVAEDLEVNSNGEVKLPYPAKNIVIGLPYKFELETLDLENENSFGINKLINKIEVKILNSREDFFIVNDNETISQNSRSRESINNPQKLFSKDVEFCPLSNSKKQVSVKILQKFPLPINIIAISATISLEGAQ